MTDESGDELARSRQWAEFYPGERFGKDYERFQVRGTESVNGHDAYVVMAWWKGGGADRIYFDVQTGLLLRITRRIESPLGALPLQTDYEDYRDSEWIEDSVHGSSNARGWDDDIYVAEDGGECGDWSSRYEKPVEKLTAKP